MLKRVGKEAIELECELVERKELDIFNRRGNEVGGLECHWRGLRKSLQPSKDTHTRVRKWKKGRE